ncbi:ras guanine nucleotide exchange factor domain-containing protein [Mycena floridula]|nr:ras guanine nucleotide exchange factor domain-containing protein [Mycena floridula]
MISEEEADAALDGQQSKTAIVVSSKEVELLLDLDGSVRGGRIQALVKRLTAHNGSNDHDFITVFLATFRSFISLDDLLDLLVQRFRIQPSTKLTPSEREKWGKLTQHAVRTQVLDIFKSMVVDEDVREKEMLVKMKEFIDTIEEPHRYPPIKQLLVLIDRAQRDIQEAVISKATPVPIKSSLKLIHIEPLELARQLTLFQSQLYQKIRPSECVKRVGSLREAECQDNITVFVQTSYQIANWIADTILSEPELQRRVDIIEHLISVADRCRTLNNFSTTIAITSGLNTATIGRLKLTWAQVSQSHKTQFAACEKCLLESTRKYHSFMANVNSPCIPFVGIILSTLRFIQDSKPDNLPGGLVNFQKRRKIYEVITEIQRWRSSFSFELLPEVQTCIEQSLFQYRDLNANGKRFWQLSLDRESRRPEEERLARLLEKSGFM